MQSVEVNLSTMQKHYIKEWRKKRGLTQGQLAERMESEPGEPLMSHVTVSNIERGVQSPTLEQLYAFAEALNVSVSMLVGNNPDMDGEVIDLLGKINDQNRPTILAMLKAAVGD
ncbi:MAG: helix-turn-helix transcriptional regulator [Alphaproteobacteria bacterium]|nr:helix-turn-helix transcriptional regulator [Alphaproteobacteria bacterium]|tara:strand:+ start:1764 stop:2105 length:342 start_codon:yes stop_codon:yes gene_type:complete